MFFLEKVVIYISHILDFGQILTAICKKSAIKFVGSKMAYPPPFEKLIHLVGKRVPKDGVIEIVALCAYTCVLY